jgi:hypothetical protein
LGSGTDRSFTILESRESEAVFTIFSLRGFAVERLITAAAAEYRTGSFSSFKQGSTGEKPGISALGDGVDCGDSNVPTGVAHGI